MSDKPQIAKSSGKSFAAPSREDCEAVDALPDDKFLELIADEIEEGLKGEAVVVSADEIVAKMKSQRARG